MQVGLTVDARQILSPHPIFKVYIRNDFKKNKTVKLVTLSKIALPPPPLPEIVT